MNTQDERKALVTEIDRFIHEAKKSYIVERWAVSYENSDPFSHTINDKNEVWWMKAQARQLWEFWQAAKAHEAEKLKGCVVVPVEPTEVMYEAYAKHSVAPMSTLSKTGYKAMIEAQEPTNE
ncbi:hypothetical protein [Acinetobacter venetianus]|uniref:hypothetical protein n=1 Tax=Acinetobacter venetianus TaxID=52133 RepID=UPI00214FB670|nr:hypothetical protein [Acinetobacter venetianus]MCR4532793.1 hypothetical protein [Acinetobacter venetianus]